MSERCRRIYAVFLICTATALASAKTTFKNLVSFDGTDDAQPYYESLVQGTNGQFYGTTLYGGGGSGNVFRIRSSGVLNTVDIFLGFSPYGAGPETGLVLGKDGNFYGTTTGGGQYGEGIVYQISGGVLTTLYNFCPQVNSNGYCPDGRVSIGQLIQGTDGDFYGTTYFGGTNNGGTVFKVTPQGALTTLYSFCAQASCSDRQSPNAGLVQATNGKFYGTTTIGGANGQGTVYEVTSSGKFTTLYSFCAQAGCSDGERPFAGLIQAGNGLLYGTASQGGSNAGGTVFSISTAGVFKLLYTFCSETACADGETPYGALIQATDGNFYGTTSTGGAVVGYGTVFQLTPAGHLTSLHAFDNSDGSQPLGGLVQGTNGTFYGTTSLGGGFGSVFSVSVGLGPFVRTIPTSGKPGANVIILGNNLGEANSVTFNGTAATFKVVSSTEIRATIPAGATTGTVQVSTPSTTLNSNIAFRVTP